jgi:hypothetical protein
VEGVAVTVRESRFWDEGLLHPAIKIKKPHRSPEHTCGTWRMRMHHLVDDRVRGIAAYKVWSANSLKRKIGATATQVSGPALGKKTVASPWRTRPTRRDESFSATIKLI